MITPELVNYVNQMRQNGLDADKITQDLRKTGWSDADITQVLSPQPVSAVPAPALTYQGIGIRALAQVIDFLIYFLVFGYIIAVIFGQTSSGGFNLTGFPAILSVIMTFLYFSLLEFFFGGTVGKLLLRLRVVKEDGSKIDFRTAVIRNLWRAIDMLPAFYLIGAIVSEKSPMKQRLGDKKAHTIVIKI